MRVLVTGGAGFIGSHLCARLLAEGHEVVCVDNLITGSVSNVAPLHDQPRFRFLQQDVAQPFDVPADAIFHLASPASPVGYLGHPVETALANGVGTYHTLELARKYGARYLFASTSEVYGEPEEHPQRESYWGHVNPNGMRSCYDESKRFGEALSCSYLRQLGLDVRIVRIFNTYGPHSDPQDGRIVPNFVTQALLGKPITVYGDGTQTRSLCYVADLVDGIHRLMFREGLSGAVVNVGNPEEHTVLEYAQLIKRLTGSPSTIAFCPPISEDDPSRRQPDITRARKLLDWAPQIGLEEGLRLTITWFRQKLELTKC